jgi:hypothetical protein
VETTELKRRASSRVSFSITSWPPLTEVAEALRSLLRAGEVVVFIHLRQPGRKVVGAANISRPALSDFFPEVALNKWTVAK